MPEAFITRDDLGDRLGRDLSTSDKALQCVDAACDIVRTLAEQRFDLVADDVETLDGPGTDALVLPQLPVAEVSAVTVDGDAVDAGDYALTSEGVVVRTDGGKWTKGRQNIAVTYTHGYAPDDMPRDVRMVALAIAGRLMRSDDVLYETNEVVGTRYGGLPTDLSAGELRILAKYRRRG